MVSDAYGMSNADDGRVVDVDEEVSNDWDRHPIQYGYSHDVEVEGSSHTAGHCYDAILYVPVGPAGLCTRWKNYLENPGMSADPSRGGHRRAPNPQPNKLFFPEDPQLRRMSMIFPYSMKQVIRCDHLLRGATEMVFELHMVLPFIQYVPGSPAVHQVLIRRTSVIFPYSMNPSGREVLLCDLDDPLWSSPTSRRLQQESTYSMIPMSPEVPPSSASLYIRYKKIGENTNIHGSSADIKDHRQPSHDITNITQIISSQPCIQYARPSIEKLGTLPADFTELDVHQRLSILYADHRRTTGQSSLGGVHTVCTPLQQHKFQSRRFSTNFEKNLQNPKSSPNARDFHKLFFGSSGAPRIKIINRLFTMNILALKIIDIHRTPMNNHERNRHSIDIDEPRPDTGMKVHTVWKDGPTSSSGSSGRTPVMKGRHTVWNHLENSGCVSGTSEKSCEIGLDF